MVERIDDEIKKEKDEFKQKYDELIGEMYENYINDEQFKEIGKTTEENSNSSLRYSEFIDLYIH